MNSFQSFMDFMKLCAKFQVCLFVFFLLVERNHSSHQILKAVQYPKEGPQFFLPITGIKHIPAHMEFLKHLPDLKSDYQVSLVHIVKCVLISHNLHLLCEAETFYCKSIILTNPNFTSFLLHMKYDTRLGNRFYEFVALFK